MRAPGRSSSGKGAFECRASPSSRSRSGQPCCWAEPAARRLCDRTAAAKVAGPTPARAPAKGARPPEAKRGRDGGRRADRRRGRHVGRRRSERSRGKSGGGAGGAARSSGGSGGGSLGTGGNASGGSGPGTGGGGPGTGKRTGRGRAARREASSGPGEPREDPAAAVVSRTSPAAPTRIPARRASRRVRREPGRARRREPRRRDRLREQCDDGLLGAGQLRRSRELQPQQHTHRNRLWNLSTVQQRWRLRRRVRRHRRSDRLQHTPNLLRLDQNRRPVLRVGALRGRDDLHLRERLFRQRLLHADDLLRAGSDLRAPFRTVAAARSAAGYVVRGRPAALLPPTCVVDDSLPGHFLRCRG